MESARYRHTERDKEGEQIATELRTIELELLLN